MAGRRIALALAALVVVAACSSGGDDAQDRPSSTSASTTTAPPSKANLGEAIDLGGGVRLTASNATIGGDDGGPWIDLAVTVENGGTADSSVPVLTIICTDDLETGGWHDSSTLQLNDPLPAGSSAEGHLRLTVPGDDRTFEPVPDCQTPAVVRVDGSPPAEIALPESLVEQINAKLIKTSQSGNADEDDG
jgi:hypothetical protein